jgi:DNA-directed RNA polymerase subunit M/transcription elongation factor TFIIS
MPERYIIPTIMENLGPAGEFLQISEHYRELTDGELLLLAGQASELTSIAQQALANEMSHRGLKLQPEEPLAPPDPEPPSDPTEPSLYAEDRRVVEICTVWSLSDALQLQSLLDNAGIPFFMGKEKATGVDKVTSNFAEGVSVQIMNIGVPWARQAMQSYAPLNEPSPESTDVPGEVEVRCPKCHSTEVIFEDLLPEPATAAETTKYKWICDSCGHEWEDDGIVRE